MILQALCEYYDRKAQLGEMPPYGYEWKPIPFIIKIKENGEFVKLESTKEGQGKKETIKKFMLPATRERSGSKSWATANLFWDHYGYVLGLPKKLDYNDSGAVDAGQKQQSTFIAEVERIYQLNPEHKGVKAIYLFYQHFHEALSCIQNDPLYQECIKKDGTNMTFTLLGECEPIAVDSQIDYGLSDQGNEENLCLVTGKHQPIAVINSAISLPFANASGAKLVGFQKGSGYDSYHKEQGFNAPISEMVNFKYTTALNTLLDKTSKNRFLFGKDSLVFWSTHSNTLLEKDFAFLFAAPPKDEPDRNVEAISNLLKAPLSGAVNDETEGKFYVLQLSPNNARIAVRLWEECTTKEMSSNIRQYFEDLDIVRNHKEALHYSLFSLLASIALQNKIENLPPALFNSMLRSAIEGLPLPELLQRQCLLRIKADGIINSKRAGLLKAYLNRKIQTTINHLNRKISMALDKENKNKAYLCGRLFAVIEKIQEAANGSATVRDQFYSAASRTPHVVFPRMIALSGHHLAKLNEGQRIYYERLKGEIMNELPAEGFPSFLSLDDQSRFAIGYYHQRQDFFTKKTEDNNNK